MFASSLVMKTRDLPIPSQQLTWMFEKRPSFGNQTMQSMDGDQGRDRLQRTQVSTLEKDLARLLITKDNVSI